jgi:hypothetical protein
MGGPTQHFFKMELEAYLRPVFLRDFIVLVFLEDFLVAAAFLTRRAFAGLFELFLSVFCAFAASATVFVAFFMGLGVRLATAFFTLVAPAFTAVSANVAAALAARSRHLVDDGFVIWLCLVVLLRRRRRRRRPSRIAASPRARSSGNLRSRTTSA